MAANRLLLLVAVVFLSALAPAFPADAPSEADLYAKADTWQETLHGSLLNLAALEDAERKAAAGARGGSADLGPWYLIGPFSNKDGKGFAQAYSPEKDIALGKPHKVKGDAEARWRRMDGLIDGQVHSLLPYFTDTEWSIAYLYRTITAKQATVLKASFGSDDGLAVWFNGEKLVSQDVPRGAAPDQDLAELAVKPGENHLLLKIVNQTGGWGYYFKADEDAVSLEPWHVIGSFDNQDGKGFAKAYPPETNIALGATYTGIKNSEAGWKPGTELVDGKVHDLRPYFTHTEWAIAYLHRKIIARKPMQITGYFGSDDGLAVWFNGEKLISQDVPRGPAPDQDKATLNLKQGENDLLMKVVNRTGGWGFYFSTKPGGGDPDENPTHRRRVNAIWDRVRAEFTSPEDQRQMSDERADDIWPVGWHPRDEMSLAKRYSDAAASHLRSARQVLEGLQQDLGADALKDESEEVRSLEDKQQTPAAAVTEDNIKPLRGLYHQAAATRDVLRGVARLLSTRMAVRDLMATYPERYANALEFTGVIDSLSTTGNKLLARPDAASLGKWEQDISSLQQRALVTENPLLDFGKLLFITRKPGGGNPGLPQNWQGNSSMRRTGWNTAINVLSPVRPDGEITTVFQSDSAFVGDLELSFDGKRTLFSMPSAEKADKYQVWETGVDGSGLRMITQSADNDYDNYDACYLPNGQIMFMSSRCYQAVPCTGGDHVALAYLMDADGRNVRQLTFDQDHSWNPTVLNDGRVIYTRWEYNDTPHYFSRILFTMHPDGTRQMAFYGTNSYFPNTMMYPRPIPGSNTKVSCILSGHHGNPRMGELAVIDTSVGESEADGVVNIIPERHRKIEAVIVDQYATGKWPQFVHPWPLSDKYFLVSCKPSPDGSWGLYLADVFDNLVPIRIDPDAALMEPIPLRATAHPPIIPNAVDLSRKDALVYLYDVYRGPGLDGVPRGTVKKLRLVEPVYRYWGNGETHSTAVDGGWDVKRILGTVPVEPDGSAFFRVPANTPIMVQPLNSENMAQQQMRSWFTAMPGEVLSCVGCHERRKEVPSPGAKALAQRKAPADIEEWYGPARGFAFETEIQPVLDRKCVKCHAKAPLDLRSKKNAQGASETRFSPAYDALHPYVRRAGLESDIRLLPPREFEANTSQLVQMLKKGHFGVKLTGEEWDRLITWIDLNVPYSGDWRDAYPPAPENLIRRREEIRAQDAANTAQVAKAGSH